MSANLRGSEQWGQPPLSSLGSQEQATYAVN
jgi:hypothetical protein